MGLLRESSNHIQIWKAAGRRRRKRLKTEEPGKQSGRRYLFGRAQRLKTEGGVAQTQGLGQEVREVTLTSFFYGESKRKDERNREQRSGQRRGRGRWS